MTDHFEQAKDAILREARANGGVTPDHLLDALIATNEDLDEKLEAQRLEAVEKHQETKTWHDEVSSLLGDHIGEAATRDRRIADLELAEQDRRTKCVPLMRQIAREHHEQVHADYVASLEGDNRSFAQILAGWTMLKKGVAIAITALIIGLVGLGITYAGAYFAAGRAEQQSIAVEKTALPQPTVTVTVTPSP